MTTEHNPVELFYSYSHRDEDLRDELEKQLTPLRRQGVISNWHDRRIGAGTEWKSQIDEHLNSAHIILLLVSADFLASDYCYDVEMARAIERHQAGEARVVPVILRACDWEGAPFGPLQALPRDGVPVTSASWPNLDEAFLNVEQGIRRAIEELTVPTITNAGPVSPSHIFIGTAHMAGQEAPVGTRVTAYINGVESGSSGVGPSGHYVLEVPGSEGYWITFSVGDHPAQEKAFWQQGAAERLELSATQQLIGTQRDPFETFNQGSVTETMKDVFLSHATEDKAEYVSPLANELDKRGISYWLDEAEIKWGDRITAKVDEGLAHSRYVVVLLSDSFMGKGWAEAELGAALSRETSDGQTIVLPLIATSPDLVFERYPLLRDKLYLPWDKGIPYIADRIGDLLRYTPQQIPNDSEDLMTEPENPAAPQEVTEHLIPSLVETSAHFILDDPYTYYEEVSSRLFAVVTKWVEFEDVESSDSRLTFPSGSLEQFASEVVLSLSHGVIPLHQILTELHDRYQAIEFRTSQPFDLGDLIRRSQPDIRPITRIATSRDDLTLTLNIGTGSLELNVKNVEDAGAVTVTHTSRSFRPAVSPIPYNTVIKYLMEDPPPTEALLEAARPALGLRPPTPRNPQED